MDAIPKLRERLQDLEPVAQWRSQNLGDISLAAFLRARKFNLPAAEAMFRIAAEWRLETQAEKHGEAYV